MITIFMINKYEISIAHISKTKHKKCIPNFSQINDHSLGDADPKVDPKVTITKQRSKTFTRSIFQNKKDQFRI